MYRVKSELQARLSGTLCFLLPPPLPPSGWPGFLTLSAPTLVLLLNNLCLEDSSTAHSKGLPDDRSSFPL